MVPIHFIILLNQVAFGASSVLLGGIFNFSSVSGLQKLEGFLLAVRQINNSTYLLNNTVIRISVRDSSLDNDRGNQLAAESISISNADACIGGSGFDTARSLCQSQIFQISDSDTSAAFSNKADYPCFARISASDAYKGFIMADIISNHYGWKKVATFATFDTYGSYGMHQFLKSARDLEVKVLSRSYFAAGETEFDSSILEALATGARIFVLFMSAADMSSLLIAGSEAGLFDEGSQIIVSDPYVHRSSWISRTQTEVAAIHKGVIGFTISTIPDYSTKKAQQFLSDYLNLANTTPDPTTHMCNLACDDTEKTQPDYGPCNYLHQKRIFSGAGITPYYNCTGTNFTALQRDGSDIDLGVMRTYDAVWLMAITIQRNLNSTGQLNSNDMNVGQALLSTLVDNISYVGVTGLLTFSNDHDQTNSHYGEGDRISGLKYDIMNFDPFSFINYKSNGSGFQKIGTWTVEKRSNITSFVTYNTIDNSVPIDSPPIVVLSMTPMFQCILLILGLILLILSGFIIIVIWIYRKKRLLKTIQLKMQYLILIGTLFGGMRVFSGSLVVSDINCSIQIWSEHLCIWFIYIPIMMKTWRIHKIVNSKSLKRITISQNFILKIFICNIICVLSYLALLQILEISTPIKLNYLYEIGIHPFSDSKCSARIPEFQIVLFAAEGTFLPITAYFSYRTWDVPGTLNESHSNMKAIIMTVMVAIMIIGVTNTGRSITEGTKEFIISIGIFLSVSCTLCSLYRWRTVTLLLGYDIDTELRLVKLNNNRRSTLPTNLRLSLGTMGSSSDLQSSAENEFRYGVSNVNPFEAMKSKNLISRKQTCYEQVGHWKDCLQHTEALLLFQAELAMQTHSINDRSSQSNLSNQSNHYGVIESLPSFSRQIFL